MACGKVLIFRAIFCPNREKPPKTAVKKAQKTNVSTFRPLKFVNYGTAQSDLILRSSMGARNSLPE